MRSRFWLGLAAIQAWMATLGSLYFSEIMHFTPCRLCWYQRICMYPLAVILTVGLWRKNKEIHLYALPLSITGWLIALYHNLLYYHLIGQQTFSCLPGAACTERYINWFGFVTIPLLSLVAFTIINLCLLAFAIRAKIAIPLPRRGVV